MILDSLNNTTKIESLHPLFKKAFDYVKSTDFSKMEDGKYEIDGSHLYVSIASLFGKEKKDAAITASFGRCGKNWLESRM